MRACCWSAPGSWERRGLDGLQTGAHRHRVSLLLPQTRTGTVRAATPLDIHGDRYVDLLVELDGDAGTPVRGRVGASDCPEQLSLGDRVSVRFTMGVMVRVERSGN